MGAVLARKTHIEYRVAGVDGSLSGCYKQEIYLNVEFGVN
jgi:hypothetical protein